MVDGIKLNNIINSSGLKKTAIADKLGISQSSLNNKISNRTEFSGSEIGILQRILDISAEDLGAIFFNV